MGIASGKIVRAVPRRTSRPEASLGAAGEPRLADIYSVTIKPEQDSPAALKAYARMHDVDDPKWLFLTGKPDDLDLLRRKLGFADPNPEKDKDKTRHSGMLRYGNEPMAIWGMCEGSAEPDWIAEEIGFAVPQVQAPPARERLTT